MNEKENKKGIIRFQNAKAMLFGSVMSQSVNKSLKPILTETEMEKGSGLREENIKTEG
jgi:hypothetical protein